MIANETTARMTNASLPLKSLTQIVVLLVVCLVALAGPAFAQTPTTIKLDMTIDVNGVGDAHVSYDLSMPPREYAALKQNFGDAFQVIRSMEANRGWLEVANLDARFEDRLQSVVSQCDARGLTRTTGPGQWTFDAGTADDGWELISVNQNQAILSNILPTPAGVVRCLTRINMPQGSTNIRYDDQAGQLAWEFHPAIEEGDNPAATLELLEQDRIMSSLAKVYSTEQSQLFAARHLFTNTGNQSLRDYRVRFRIDGYSSWSPWKQCKVVYPGQTVLDYFYPVMDIDKLCTLTGSRHAMIEMEAEYTTADGERVRESDGRRVQLLSRNEVVYSTRRDSENLNWFEQFDLVPMILTAFTNGTDPVMQQFAGRVSSLAGGPASSLDPDQAVAFLGTMWQTLEYNRISYQTSPGLSYDQHFGQHVKFGRDVLQNRAGTCIDLAILWASAAESVGLNPCIAVIPGHAFPVIQLPNGNLLPIEATLVGHATFEQALEKGLATLEAARQDGRLILVDVYDMKHNQGIRSLDLPVADEDVLTKWGYDFDTLQASTTAEEPVADQTVEQPTQVVASVDPIVGDWKTESSYNGYVVRAVQRFKADGSYFCVGAVTDPNGAEQVFEEQGTWQRHADRLEFNTNLGQYTQEYKWVDANRFKLLIPQFNAWFEFERAN
jgi:hypothetical protein